LYVIVFLLGAVAGCFLNLAIDRLLAAMSLVNVDSYEETSQRGLMPWELLPVISYLFQQGRFRQDNVDIPFRALVVEIVTGSAFVFTYVKYGVTPQWGVLVFYFALFLTIAVIDMEHGLILDKLVYPACLVTSVLSSFYPLGLAEGRTLPGSFAYSLLGGAVAFVILLIPALIWVGRMGWGDVKFAGLVGIITGFPGGLVALAVAMLGGGLAAIYHFFGLKERHASIPFGPFLSAGGLIALIWGQTITDWYLGFFS